MAESDSAEDVFLDLIRASHLARADQMPGLAADAVARLGGGDAVIYLISHEQTQLVCFGHDDSEPLNVETTLGGRAFRLVEIQTNDAGSGQRLWVPLLDGLVRVGVLALSAPADLAADERFRIRIRRLASLLAEMLMAKRGFGDTIERTVRIRPVSVAGELIWRLLPPTTVGGERVVIAAAVEPAYDVGGDVFDYALDFDQARFAIFDAMGHGLGAGLLASVALASYRTARRSRVPLEDVVRGVDAAVHAHFGGDRFVTGIVAELDLERGLLRWVRAGHPLPFLLRDSRMVKALECPPTLPLGIGLDEVHVAEESLQPGDRLLLYTDGVLEARSAEGEFFGAARLGDFAAKECASGEPAPEVLRRLTQAVLAHHAGELQDDATLMLVEWEATRPDALLL